MIIVSDTTPINYLVLIGEAEILKHLFGQVIIPQAVYDEFHNPGTPQLVRAWADAAPSWLEIRQASAQFIALVKKLGAGEREAIALAMELQASAILMDERKGTKEARKNNFLVVGTLALLERASQRDLLDLAEAIDRLKQTNFRFPPADIVQEMLDKETARRQQE